MRNEPLVGSRPPAGRERSGSRSACGARPQLLCQTVLNQVRAGKRDAVQVVDGERAGLRIDANGDHDTLC
jgi:hypothetical protein